MIDTLFYPIIVPFVIGCLCLIISGRYKRTIETIAVLGSIAAFILTISIFYAPQTAQKYFILDNLSRFILLAIGLFGFLVTLYSVKFITSHVWANRYYCYILWTIGAACGAVLANDLILLLVFWGFLGLTLYLLIGLGGEDAAPAAKKTLIIIGGTDCLMILGIAIIWFLAGTFQMDKIHLMVSGSELTVVAFLCLAIASFAKAGAMPVHTWIPDCAEKAPIPVTAFLPASLDKLLGIYLLARIAMNLFVMTKAMGLVLLIVGAVTIIAAVMMAMVQHDMKKLLSYHAVSQVGYMVLGIGTGNPIGIAGGVFHMLNHAIYKACLFLCAGGVEHKTKTTDLDKLGGLAKIMPITFVTCLIAALSISGVPPFNGFVSKWMVYQGVIELGKNGDKLWIVWLVAAMFGSTLTLASFMKLIHAAFLGQPFAGGGGPAQKRNNEVHWNMWLPMVILAGLCVIFGVFAFQIPLKHFIMPSLHPGHLLLFSDFAGLWAPGLATLLIIIGLIVGAIIYFLGRPKAVREDISYVGGELLPEEHRVTGVDFYQTVQEMGPLNAVYQMAENKFFDIYNWGKNLTFVFTRGLQITHTGILTTYVSWIFVGLVILFFVMVK